MTLKELNINTVMKKIIDKEIIIKEAAILISKSERQTKRIKKRYLEEGAKGLIHKLRGRESNHTKEDSRYSKAICIIKDKYYDYGPTLSAEKLLENHNIILNVSSLRREMIREGIWKHKIRKKKKRHFTARERKSCYGEMIQYDGSYHKWFEGRKGTEFQCLLVSVDDATNELTAKFAKNEGWIETFKFWKEYSLEKGKPKSIYLDKYATYKVNYPDATDDKDLPTQFGKSCKNLGIKLIFANTPQAKGRVERMNGTLQDRLVKALREVNISDVKSANVFLKEIFIPDFNKKFMVQPRSNSNLHLKLRSDELENLDQTFSKHETRVIQNDFTIKFKNNFYQLFRNPKLKYTLRRGEIITVETHLNGDIRLSKNGIYIDSKRSFTRPKRIFKLLTAPISFEDLKSIKSKIEIEEKQDKLRIAMERKNKNTDTYYAKYGKSHPFVANAI